MKKLAFFLGLAIAIFASAQIASATQIINDTLQVSSLKVGEQGVGGVTFFNGTIINETTNNGIGNPVTFGDDVRIDGRVYRGSTVGYGDNNPFIVNDDLQVEGDIMWNSVNSLQSYITSLVNTNNTQETSITSLNTNVSSQLSSIESLTSAHNEAIDVINDHTVNWGSFWSFMRCVETKAMERGLTYIAMVDWFYCQDIYFGEDMEYLRQNELLLHE